MGFLFINHHPLTRSTFTAINIRVHDIWLVLVRHPANHDLDLELGQRMALALPGDGEASDDVGHPPWGLRLLSTSKYRYCSRQEASLDMSSRGFAPTSGSII